MSASKVLTTEKTVVQVGDGASPEVFTTIGQMTDFDGPTTTTDKIKKTHLLSTSQEYRPSLIPDNGELSMTIEFDPTNAKHTQLETDQIAGTTRTYQLVWHDPTSGASTDPGRKFTAFISEFARKGGGEGENILADVTFVITGDITTVTVTRP